jgi:DNA primase RepB-like protein
MAKKNTDEAVQLQAAAMHSEVFEVGLFDPNSCRQMLPRVWDRDTLLRSIPWLRLKNGRGRNIYIRPSGEHRLTLLDDIGWRTVGRLKEEGFEPAVIVETSPGNFQAWINHGEVLPRELSTFVARLLTRRFLGDPASADWRHYGRLAGFTNRKEKYRKENGLYPFVLLHEASGRMYRRASEFLSEAEEMFNETKKRRMSVAHAPDVGHPQYSLKTIEDFRRRSVYGGDQTRSDLAYAIYALAHGVPESALREQLASRDLSHKGNQKRQQEYLDRTVVKAHLRVKEAYSRVPARTSNVLREPAVGADRINR